MPQDNLTNKQLGEDGLSQYAIFLPAISGFYATFIGKQREGNYVDPARFPAGLTDMEQLNWLNDQKALFPYKWSLYSGGHANLDLNKPDATENMVRQRDPNTFILGDSGGFQIGKGLWQGDWRDPSGPDVAAVMADCVARKTEKRKIKDKKGNDKEIEVDLVKEYQAKLDAAQKKRQDVLNWLDNVANYGMILDIPAWVVRNPEAAANISVFTHQQAVDATKYNNEYFIKHRKGVENGGAKFLNVLQGENHSDADDWYETMKQYSDPAKYPGRHFDGWAMGGQNMCDVHLILKRLVALRYDNLLQEGKHDWMHFLGTSKLEWAVLLTVIQRAVRKYVNPSFTISFDCASPFLATANGQVYHHIDLPQDGKWTYRMSPSIDDKKYSTDNRSFRDVAMTDYHSHFKHFDDSPVSQLCKIRDICIYKPGDLNKIGKEGKTSWDSFSYALQMAHNVWIHLESVQRANRDFDAGNYPAMMRRSTGDYAKFQDIVEAIFAAPDRASAEEIIEHYDGYWMEIIGTRGAKGKKAKNANTMFSALFDAVEDDDGFADDEVEFDEGKLEDLK